MEKIFRTFFLRTKRIKFNFILQISFTQFFPLKGLHHLKCRGVKMRKASKSLHKLRKILCLGAKLNAKALNLNFRKYRWSGAAGKAKAFAHSNIPVKAHFSLLSSVNPRTRHYEPHKYLMNTRWKWFRVKIFPNLWLETNSAWIWNDATECQTQFYSTLDFEHISIHLKVKRK